MVNTEAYEGSKSISSQKTELYVKDDSDALVRVGELTTTPSISDGEKPNVDSTNLSSEVQEFISGLADPNSSEAEFQGNFIADDAGQLVVQRAYKAGDTRDFEVRMPFNDPGTSNRATASFSATVKLFDLTPAVNETLRFNASLVKKSATTCSWLV